MDRSTGRVVVVVPFFRLRCALAASLLAGGVESVSAALRLRRGREREERGRERGGGGGGGDAEEGGSTGSKVLSISLLTPGWHERPLETPHTELHCKKRKKGKRRTQMNR